MLDVARGAGGAAAWPGGDGGRQGEGSWQRDSYGSEPPQRAPPPRAPSRADPRRVVERDARARHAAQGSGAAHRRSSH